MVGEQGPETFVPRSAGAILPAGGGQISINVNAGWGADGAEIARAVRDEILKLKRRNATSGL
jgi:hypothetical protein